MRHLHTRALVLIALAAPLGACNSFLGIKFARHAAPAPARVEAPAVPAATAALADSATALGRKQLAEGQTGLAIESFQKALGSGEPVAPAVNGLGVAYARLGRFELAWRYFEQAKASDPANPAYADNLARLLRSPALAMRRDGDIARDQAAASARQGATAAPPAATRAPALGQLQRVSRGEVRIATAPAQSAPVAAQHAAGEFKPLVRFSIAEQTAPHGPVRIVLPEPKPADAATLAAAAKAEAGAATR